MFAFILIVLSAIQAQTCGAFKMNAGNLLLPPHLGGPHFPPSTFDLRITGGGCYVWDSTHPNLVSVTPLQDGAACSTSARIAALSQHPLHHDVVIRAEDVGSSLMLSCDVAVDDISKLEILSTTRRLYYGEEPVKFQVQARTLSGDTFSSLNGIPFCWSVSNKNVSTAPVLKLMKLSASMLECPPDEARWECLGYWGAFALVGSVSTGHGLLSVQIFRSYGLMVEPATIPIKVVANLVLKPEHQLALVPGSRVRYHVHFIRNGRLYEMPMPSDQYVLEPSDDSGVIKFDTNSSEVLAVIPGTTSLVLHDTNVLDDQGTEAVIRVTLANFIELDLEPLNSRWALQEGLEYSVVARLFDSRRTAIFPANNLKVVIEFPGEFFDVVSVTPNGTYAVVVPVKPGITSFEASFEGLLDSDTEPSTFIHRKEIIRVFSRLTIDPEFSFLPWNPDTNAPVKTLFKGRGGSGQYEWSLNVGPAVVSKAGPSEAVVTAMEAGKPSYLALTDILYPNFIAGAEFSVAPPEALEVPAERLEGLVGEPLLLRVAMAGRLDPEQDVLHMFTNCSSLQLTLEITDPSKLEQESDKTHCPEALQCCQCLHLRCKAEAFVKVTVSYVSSRQLLSKSLVVACFLPLQALQSSKLLLAKGTSIEVGFSGGPRPWPHLNDDHYVRGELSDSAKMNFKLDQIRNSLLQHKNVHVFRLFCFDHSMTTLFVTVGNLATSANLVPLEETAVAEVSCAPARYLELQVIRPRPRLHSFTCPELDGSLKVPMQAGTPFDVQVQVLAEAGPLANHSIYVLSLELADHSMARFRQPKLQQELDHSGGYRRLARVFRTVETSPSLLGSFFLTAILEEFVDPTDLAEMSIRTITSRAIEIETIHDPRIQPSTLALYNHPKIKDHLHILGGSGYFHLECKNQKVVDLYVNDTSRRDIQVSPVKDGSVILTVYDRCLDVRQVAQTQIFVSSRLDLRLVMVDKIPEKEGVLATVEVKDFRGCPISQKVLVLLHLQPIVSDNTVLSVRHQEMGQEAGIEKFWVHALRSGTSSLSFSTGLHTTPPLPVLVFPPLVFHPVNLTLVPGAAFQIRLAGGPQTNVHFKFSVHRPDIAKVTPSGVVTGLTVGKTFVSVGDSKNVRQKVDVSVICLRGIRIRAPLRKLAVGSQMPLFATGLSPLENPFAFAAAEPQLYIHWSVDNDHVLQLTGVFGEDLAEHRSASVRVKARTPGHAVVTLEIQPGNLGQLDHILVDQLHLEVFENLWISKPENFPEIGGGNKILMAPHSAVNLGNSREVQAHTTYEVVALKGEGPVVVLEPPSLLRSLDHTGNSLVYVTAKEDFGVAQITTVLVQVRPVAYVTLTCQMPLLHHPLPYIPLGLSVALQVTAHSQSGEILHPGSLTDLVFTLSRFDRVLISQRDDSNASQEVKTLAPGSSVVKVSGAGSEDFVVLRVAPGISPSRARLTQGEVVCFTGCLQGPGRWSTDHGAVAIEPSSGVGVAIKPGPELVAFLGADGKQRIFHRLEVQAATSIALDTSHLRLVSNVEGAEFSVGVNLLGHGMLEGPASFNWEECSKRLPIAHLPTIPIPFSCSVVFTNSTVPLPAQMVFVVEPDFNWANGRFRCRLRPRPGHTLKPKDWFTMLAIRAQLVGGSTCTRCQLAVTTSVLLPFLPALQLLEPDLRLSPFEREAFLEVAVHPSLSEYVHAVPSHPRILHIRPPIFEPLLGHLLYLVHLREWQMVPSDLHITLECPYIAQAFSVPVHVLPETTDLNTRHFPDEDGPKSNFDILENFLFLIIMVLLIFAIGIFVIHGVYRLLSPHTPPRLEPVVIFQSPGPYHNLLGQRPGRSFLDNALYQRPYMAVYDYDPWYRETSPRRRRGDSPPDLPGYPHRSANW